MIDRLFVGLIPIVVTEGKIDSGILILIAALLAGDLAQSGIPTLLEASRRGGHLWVHLAEPSPAALVRT